MTDFEIIAYFCDL